MTREMPAWMISLVSVVIVSGGLFWWIYSTTTPATITTAPAVSDTKSPLSPTIIDELKKRTVYGNIPLKDASPYDRSDPFATK